MNCDWAKDNIVLYIYEELPDDARFEFERHVQRCVSCHAELESAREFKHKLGALPVQEVSPNFLTSNRMELQEALEHAQPARSGWGMFVFDFAGWMHQLKLAPALTAALLVIGFAGGTLTGWRISQQPGPPSRGDGQQPQATIATVESVVPQPNSNKVTIKYDTLNSQIKEGDSNDPEIQQLLLMAARNNRNSGVRLDSIDILKSQPEDNAVREALVYALRYDQNPGVRLKALDGLKGYVKDDVHVRDAVLEALLHDANAGVRSQAISLLDVVKADSSVRDTLKFLAERDQSQYIRNESKRILASMPNLD
ncbi:MAG TPA: zf-HC2 domain-containing protein [Candidatus Angelobacter sp.]